MSFDSPRLERLRTVVARTGMSRSWLYKEVAAGRFPPPCKVGGASRWSTAAIDAWIHAHFDAQERLLERASERFDSRSVMS